MLPKNWGEPMGAPAIFEKQIEIAVQVRPYITRLRDPSRRRTVKRDWPNRLGWRHR
ncbi:MAG: hypothetical protein P8X89_16315 [Reinekea sp.]